MPCPGTSLSEKAGLGGMLLDGKLSAWHCNAKQGYAGDQQKRVRVAAAPSIVPSSCRRVERALN